MKNTVTAWVAGFASLALVACSGNGPDESDAEVVSNGNDSDVNQVEPRIRINQVGFLPGAAKLAVVPDEGDGRFSVLDAETGEPVLTGDLSIAAVWAPADQQVRIADFSDLTEPGEYRLRVPGLGESQVFRIQPEAYRSLNDAALKAFYFNRASTELLPEHAGQWARPAGHPDTEVEIHPSAATEDRPAGTIVSAPKGWYDAGDFNKYIVNSGITMHALLSAYEHFPAYYAAQDLTIPESGEGGAPDILHESWWNLEWMLEMQDPYDGGVYHKLTTARFADAVMPHTTDATRYMVAKGTEATLNFAATMAMASRVYAPYDEVFGEVSERMLAAAKDAWEWAEANPDVRYDQNAMNEVYDPDVVTGAYSNANIDLVRAWAATELYLTTGDREWREQVDLERMTVGIPSWSNSGGLLWMSLAGHLDQLADADRTLVEGRFQTLGDGLLAQVRGSAWRLGMNVPGDFFWGSNSYALNQAMMLIQAYRLSENREYLDAAHKKMDYVLGRNPTGYSFVTGFGLQQVMDPHHRVSYADDIEDPVPGFVLGGPHNSVQDDCGADEYPSNLPALSFIDHWCSYSTNEVAINWNAPLVYVTGALQALTADER
ncbi:glycoside hydrolase family 9 protein [Marinimicrobium alkaliphilum]|uniref:glycoside hydrolase family 9 protein n=1 Tax=Marinimicrobium alkaliphilum TaxID=2202654 RepID=UPI001E5F3C66|nr:glycoside hydrolase family 9 protein [Marinimicrobium alkaliphilum]